MTKKYSLVFLLMTIIMLGLSGCKSQDAGVEEDEKEVLAIETSQENDEKPITLKKDVMKIENGNLQIENLSPYNGNDFRNGEISEVSQVYAVKITNLSDDMIRAASLIFNDGDIELEFSVEFLPAGESTIVIESEQKKGVADNLLYVEGEVEYFENAENSMDSVAISFAEDDSVNVRNQEEKDISLLWLICKPFNNEDETYGEAYIVAVDTLGIGEEQTIETELSKGDYQIVWAQRIE